MSDHLLHPEHWIANYGDALYGFAFTRLRDEDLASELVQATIVTALEKRHSFKGTSSEKTWLIAILKNKIVDHVRQDAKSVRLHERETETDFFFESALGKHWSKDSGPKEWEAASEDTDREELFARLAHCMEQLPAVWMRLMILKVVDELSTEQLCKELSLTASNLWVTMHRARLRLRACIEPVWL